MRLTEEQWTLLAHRLQHAIVESAPGWTEPAAHDPGITILQLLDYALDQLQLRSPGLDARGRRLAQQVAERALTLVQRPVDDGDCGPGLQRVRYAAGMVLTVDDFRADQDYFLSRLQRRNRRRPASWKNFDSSSFRWWRTLKLIFFAVAIRAEARAGSSALAIARVPDFSALRENAAKLRSKVRVHAEAPNRLVMHAFCGRGAARTWALRGERKDA